MWLDEEKYLDGEFRFRRLRKKSIQFIYFSIKAKINVFGLVSSLILPKEKDAKNVFGDLISDLVSK